MFEQLAYRCKKIKSHKLENHEKQHTSYCNESNPRMQCTKLSE